MGRIVWFGLVAMGAPAEVVIGGIILLVGGTAYLAYKAGQESNKLNQKMVEK